MTTYLRGAGFGPSCRWLACLVGLAMANVSLGGTGNSVIVPGGRELRTTPYTVHIEPRWCDVNGYRPIRVEVRRRAASVARDERVVKVRIAPAQHGLWENPPSFEQEVTIPEGQAAGEAVFYVHQDRPYRTIIVTVTEGGRVIKELRSQYAVIDNNYNYELSEAEPAILIIDYDGPPLKNRDGIVRQLRAGVDAGTIAASSNLPDLRPLASATLANYSFSGRSNITDARALEELQGWSRLLLVAPADISDPWLSLAGIDLIFISWADMQRIVADDPDKWALVRDWLLAGGNLVTYGVGAQYEQLAELEGLLAMEPRSPSEDALSMYRGWNRPAVDRYGRGLEYLQADRSRSAADVRASGFTSKSRQELADGPSPFVYRELGMGTISAFGSSLFPGDEALWNWFLNTLTPQRWLWHHRHGLSLRRENPDFWDFMIPNVGMAPVNAFRVLITAFVIVIGPVNYWVLKRAKRIGWMMVTVPVGAAAIIASLFLYALVTDGLGVQYRVRSLSHIDQQREHVVNWSRQSYYAGLTPSRGFHFPLDVAIYPIDQLRAHTSSSNAPRRHVVWDTSQNLRTGYIEPRVTSQFLIVRSRASKRGLQISGDGAGRAPQVVNRLGTNVKRLFVCDAEGELYAASDVGMGATAKLEPLDEAACRAELDRYFKQAPLAPPEAFDEQSWRQAVSMSQSYYYYGSTDTMLGLPNQHTSALERELNTIRTAWPEESDRQTYVAIVERDPEVALGVGSGTSRIGLSLIRGEY